MFGRATIRLGIGPHSSIVMFWSHGMNMICTETQSFTMQRLFRVQKYGMRMKIS